MSTERNREHPILMHRRSIHGIRSKSVYGTGMRKTQTRRLVRNPPEAPPGPESEVHEWMRAEECGGSGPPWGGDYWLRPLWRPLQRAPIVGGTRISSPYGGPGDRLWVRETWGLVEGADIDYQGGTHHEPEKLLFAADCEEGTRPNSLDRWRPSIYMPRARSRYLLEVDRIRIERLNDISDEDIVAEGVVSPDSNPAQGKRHINRMRVHWCSLWDQTQGNRPGRCVADNPWVWVVDFHLLTEGL